MKKRLTRKQQERRRVRKAWLETADYRKREYQRIQQLSTTELLDEITLLAKGDNFDEDCGREFSPLAYVIFSFARRTLRERIKKLEAMTTGYHRLVRWEYDNATEREAASGFSEDDLGKLARQSDTGETWMLVSRKPVWQRFEIWQLYL